jgi:hypothetical protein
MDNLLPAMGSPLKFLPKGFTRWLGDYPASLMLT